MQAHALATVISNDALNVFITLSARALNPELSIVARAANCRAPESKTAPGRRRQGGAAEQYRR